MLVNQISNMHSSRFKNNNCAFSLIFKLSKLVEVGESRWIEFKHIFPFSNIFVIYFYFAKVFQIL
jgi:hypothetical protein